MPSRGNYWQKGGLPDETVKEEDLSQALQAKVNAGGGSDGQSPTLDKTVWFDEFVYSNNTAYFNKYQASLRGSINARDGGQGTIELDSDGILGDGFVVNMEGTFEIELFTRGDAVYELIAGSPSEDDEALFYFGLAKVITPFSATISENRLEVNNDAMMGFILDPAISSNIRCISRQGVTSTTTQTTKSGSQSHNYKIIHTKSPLKDEFFIDGSLVATHTTNIANENSMKPQIALYQITANTSQIKADYWRIEQVR